MMERSVFGAFFLIRVRLIGSGGLLYNQFCGAREPAGPESAPAGAV